MGADLSSRTVQRSSIALTKRGYRKGKGPFLFFARPPPAGSSSSAGLKYSPAPGAEGGAGDDIDLPGVLSYYLPSSYRPVPSHSFIVRSTTRNWFAGHPRRSVKLVVYPIRSGGAVSAVSSRRRHFRYSSGLRPYVPLSAHPIRETRR